MPYLKSEQETILRFDYLDQKWYVWTTIPSDIQKFQRLGWKKLRETREKGIVIDAEYEGMKNFVTLRDMTKPARVPKNAFLPKVKERITEEEELYE